MNKALIVAGMILATLSLRAQAVGGLVDLSIYDRTEGRELPVYSHDGKYYVPGRPGNEYQIKLRSQHGDDVLNVVSVDGVNVVSGDTAAWNQTGYLISPWDSTSIKGWRKSQSHVAQFYFTKLPDSYAARTGRPDNVGVIGVAVFRRKPEPHVYEPAPYEPPYHPYGSNESEGRYAPESSARGNSKAAPSAKYKAHGDQPSTQAESAAKQRSEEYRAQGDSYRPAPAQENKLGTGHGRSEKSRVRYVDFERASDSPDEVITIYYDSWRNLAALGIVPDHHAGPREPEAFPGYFVPDPPRRRY